MDIPRSVFDMVVSQIESARKSAADEADYYRRKMADADYKDVSGIGARAAEAAAKVDAYDSVIRDMRSMVEYVERQ